MRCVGAAALLVFGIASTTFGQISARVALNKPVIDLKLDGSALTDAFEYLTDLSGANVHVNWAALEEAGVSKDQPVSARLRGVSLKRVLTLLLDEAAPGQLAYYIDDNVIEITTRALADAKMTTRMYPVEDLLVEIPDFVAPSLNLTDSVGGQNGQNGGGSGGGGRGLFDGGNNGNRRDQDDDKGKTRAQRAQELIELIKELLMPDVWTDNGGQASIRFFNGSLIVTAPNSVHEALGGPID